MIKYQYNVNLSIILYPKKYVSIQHTCHLKFDPRKCCHSLYYVMRKISLVFVVFAYLTAIRKMHVFVLRHDTLSLLN